MRSYVSSLSVGLGAAALLLGPAGCAERSGAERSGARAAVLMECNTGRTNCREVARYSTLEICNRERANYLARNKLREAYCTTGATASR
ncbi:MAG: hypothetical protein ACK40O_02850 [Allosphingosinicella sp.]